ncbi:MAG TPA: hypothetical protein P5244_04110 [Syntrophales bacterium]|nr:hypothetical protein [Syntrophales bacterium]
MEDILNTVNDVQEAVVEPQEAEATTSEVVEGEETQVETPEAEPVAKVQSAEENAKFAEIRRKYEAEARAVKAQNERLLQALKSYGYEGSPEEIADMLTAQQQGISQEEARAQREALEAENAKLIELETQVQTYKSLAIEKLKADDLAKLKSAYPNDQKVQSLKSIDDLGDDFFALMSALKDPTLAYDALMVKRQRETKPVPKDIGAVNSSSAKEKDFYTKEEVDKLPPEAYDNPKIMEAIRKSMLKW